ADRPLLLLIGQAHRWGFVVELVPVAAPRGTYPALSDVQPVDELYALPFHSGSHRFPGWSRYVVVAVRHEPAAIRVDRHPDESSWPRGRQVRDTEVTWTHAFCGIRQ